MSYDIEIRLAEKDLTCPHCNGVIGHQAAEALRYWDPTYNYGPMFRAACGTEHGIHDWDGKTVAEVLPLLEAMYATLAADPVKFKAFDASNGWGTYRDLMPFLRDNVLPAFREAPPDAVVRVS
jgi:hypothetical protein